MAYKLLDGVGTIGVSPSMKVVNGIDHSIQVDWVDGVNVTAIIVDLEGSLDNVHFFQLGTHTATGAELTANQFMFHISGRDVKYVRANITTLTDAGTPVVNVRYDIDSREIGGH